MARFWHWKHWPVVLGSTAILLGIIAIIIFLSGRLQGPTAEEPPNAAEWLSAISTFWGAVAAAVGALLTAGALLIAALSYRKQVADRHKAQAVSVTVGSRTEIVPAVRARTASINGYFNDRKKHFYFVRNDSPLPIYRVELRVGESDDLKSSSREVLAPGDEESFEVSFAPFPALARFTDSAGVAWKRESSGRLTEIADDYSLSTW